MIEKRAVPRNMIGNLKTHWKHSGGLFLLIVMGIMITGHFAIVGVLQ